MAVIGSRIRGPLLNVFNARGMGILGLGITLSGTTRGGWRLFGEWVEFGIVGSFMGGMAILTITFSVTSSALTGTRRRSNGMGFSMRKSLMDSCV